MAKDIGYAMSEASKKGAPLLTAAPALEIFKRAAAEGMGDQDFSAVLKAAHQN
jgi:3-hydroxyisobutyrate dehydrogenase-like beta-hydroxyacid dehydrogenase